MSFQIYFWESIDKSHEENIKIYQQLWFIPVIFTPAQDFAVYKIRGFILYTQFTKLIFMFLPIN